MQAQTAVYSRCCVPACCFSRHRRRGVRVQASTYTQTAQQAIKSAQQEACRQGSLFLAPPHLVLVSFIIARLLCGHNHWDLVLVARIHTQEGVSRLSWLCPWLYWGCTLLQRVHTTGPTRCEQLQRKQGADGSRHVGSRGRGSVRGQADAAAAQHHVPRGPALGARRAQGAADRCRAVHVHRWVLLSKFTGGCCCGPLAVHDCAPALAAEGCAVPTGRDCLPPCCLVPSSTSISIDID